MKKTNDDRKRELFERAPILLAAAIAIIENTAGDAALEATAIWDNAECDGACLVNECTSWLEDFNSL